MIVVDAGVILVTKRFSESSFLVKCFLQNHGIVAGIVRDTRASRVLNPGTVVDAKWQARLPEHLGAYTLEPQVYNPIYTIILDIRKNILLSSALHMISCSIPEKEPQVSTWHYLYMLLNLLEIEQNALICLNFYIALEAALLQINGFTLDYLHNKSDSTYDIISNAIRTLTTFANVKNSAMPEFWKQIVNDISSVISGSKLLLNDLLRTLSTMEFLILQYTSIKKLPLPRTMVAHFFRRFQ
ncbi:DNA repair protein RecO (recombination protein O) [Alphaproteobacteria bacterium]